MSRKPRRLVINEAEPGIYHIYSRTVRRAFLLGEDAVTSKCYRHRLEVLQRLVQIFARIFAIDVLGFGFMQNHFHEILRNRPDLVARMSDFQIAYRWCLLNEQGMSIELKQRSPRQLRRLRQKVETLMRDPDRMRHARKSLSSISCYEQRLKGTIARFANKEDEVTGHFWDGRFEAKRIEDSAQLLTTMVYVDLNAVRAGMVDTPEESQYTAAYERIHGLKARMQAVADYPDQELSLDELLEIQSTCEDGDVRWLLDAWLSPIDERREGVPTKQLDWMEWAMEDGDTMWTTCPERDPCSECGAFSVAAAKDLPPSEGVALRPYSVCDKDVAVGTAHASSTSKVAVAVAAKGETELDLPCIAQLPPRASNKGCLPMSLSDYLAVLDWTGRQVHPAKQGKIPDALPGILDRLGFTQTEAWLKAISEYAGRVKNVFTAQVNQVTEASRCVVQTSNGPRTFLDALL